MSYVEMNFDGLIGPCHNYGGLSYGNVASAKNAGFVSNPRKAALQGIAKMRKVMGLGLEQGFFLPHERPSIPILKGLGCKGNARQMVSMVAKIAPDMLNKAYSSSSMWAANAATISPSPDCKDGLLHITVANLSTMLHRSIEARQSEKLLRTIFADTDHFAIHDALPMHASFSDEGAANHVRLCAEHSAPGIEIFVYGRDAWAHLGASDFPARQSLLASQSVARSHSLSDERTIFVQQSDEAIAGGAFHNDVVCVGTKNCLFYHEQAFQDKAETITHIRRAAQGLFEPEFVEVPASQISLHDAVQSYLFNSQLLEIPDSDRLLLLAPEEVRQNPATHAYCQDLVTQNTSIGQVEFVDIRQSMRNGGGPACLRLRVALSKIESAAIHPAFIATPEKLDNLEAWIKSYYREQLAPKDLADPDFVTESYEALDALTKQLGLPSNFYPFQQ